MLSYLVVVVFVCAVSAQGPGGRISIKSCEGDAIKRHDCVTQQVKPVFDSDKVEACFKTCTSKGKGDGKGEGKGEGKGKGDMGGNNESFFKCIITAKQQCIKTNAASVQLADAAAPKGGERRGWFQHGGGPRGGGGRTNLLDGLLNRATECNVKDCVTAAIGADLLKDTAAGSARIEKAMCTARQTCAPSAQCASDRAAIRAAECVCKPQQETIMTTCKTQFPPSNSGPGSWSGSGPHSWPGSGPHSWPGSGPGPAKFAGKGDHDDDPCKPPVARPCPA